MPSALQLCAGLYVFTILLVIVVETAKRTRIARPAALLSIPTAAVAGYLLVSQTPTNSDWVLVANWEPSNRPAPRRTYRDGPGDGPNARVSDTARAGAHRGGREADEIDIDEGGSDPAPAGVGTSVANRIAALLTPAVATVSGPEAVGASLRDCSSCPEMVVVPAGTSTIGADAADPLASAAERPA